VGRAHSMYRIGVLLVRGRLWLYASAVLTLQNATAQTDLRELIPPSERRGEPPHAELFR
jgi:hypothetical protein